MLSRRFALPIAVLAFCSAAFAQAPAAAPATPSDAQKSFALLKTLAGDWTGPLTTDSATWKSDKPLYITMHLASRGNALAHELKEEGSPPELTVFYVDGDRVNWSIIAIMRIGLAWLRDRRRTESLWNSSWRNIQAAMRSGT